MITIKIFEQKLKPVKVRNLQYDRVDKLILRIVKSLKFLKTFNCNNLLPYSP